MDCRVKPGNDGAELATGLIGKGTWASAVFSQTGEQRSAAMTALLEIRNLKAEVAGKQIIDGMNLVLNKGEVHAIMGPNGAGKSTLSYVLAGKPGYTVTGGEALLNG